MKSILKKIKVEIIVLVSLLTVFLSLTLIKVPYDITLPATVDQINNIYSFDGIDSSNININSVSVIGQYKVNVLNYIIAKMNPYAIVEKHNDMIQTSTNYEYASGSLQKTISHTNALIAGYKQAGKQIDYNYRGAIVHTIFGNSIGVFEVADIIKKIDNEEITETNSIISALKNVCGVVERNGHYYIDFQLNHPYKFTVSRQGKEVVLDVYAMEVDDDGEKINTIGINYYDYYQINKNNTSPSFEIGESNTLGPSAGLMQSLFTYLSLTDSHLVDNLKIVGTGTVDVNGKAGAIGGAASKIAAAILAKADIFFVPEQNYDEAYSMYKKFKTNMQLVKVSSLEDCINYLKGLGDKNV